MQRKPGQRNDAPGIDVAVGRLPNGLYKVTLDDGSVLYTHGGDPKPLHGAATHWNLGSAANAFVT